jgi:outer membrane immunogenic protein
MKKIFLSVGTLAALSCLSCSFAASGLINDNVAKSGAYLGIAGGIGGMDTAKFSSSQKAQFSSYSEKLRKGVAARVYGGYLWNIQQVENLKLGAELGYNYYPNNEYKYTMSRIANKFTYKGYNVDLLGVAKYNFGETGFNVIGKAGGAYVYQKLSETASGISKNTSKHKILPEIALGIGYDITQNFDVNLMYAHIFGDKPSIKLNAVNDSSMQRVASVNTLMLGVAYHFAL